MKHKLRQEPYVNDVHWTCTGRTPVLYFFDYVFVPPSRFLNVAESRLTIARLVAVSGLIAANAIKLSNVQKPLHLLQNTRVGAAKGVADTKSHTSERAVDFWMSFSIFKADII